MIVFSAHSPVVSVVFQEREQVQVERLFCAFRTDQERAPFISREYYNIPQLLEKREESQQV